MLKICAAFIVLVAFSATAVADTCYSDRTCGNKIKGKSDISGAACLKTKGPGKSWDNGGDCVNVPQIAVVAGGISPPVKSFG